MPLVRPCRNRYCPEYGDETGWCPAHRKEPFAGQPPMPPGWASIRAGQLAAFPWCQECGRALAVEVHHVISRAAGGGDEPGNLRSLCSACHAGITGRAGGASFP